MEVVVVASWWLSLWLLLSWSAGSWDTDTLRIDKGVGGRDIPRTGMELGSKGTPYMGTVGVEGRDTLRIGTG